MTYVRGLIVEDIVQVHAAFQRVITKSRQLPAAKATTALLERAYRTFNHDLDALAVASARDAEARIKDRLQKTARRPDTGVAPHLRSGIKCRPLRGTGPFATGAVGIVDLKVIERVMNPLDPSRVPYWIVQEEGTAANVGRTIFGFFFDRGYVNATRPARGYTGTPQAQPLFATGRVGNLPSSVRGGIGPRGGRGGKGEIRRPIPARHFVRDGADQARNDWRLGIRVIERDALLDIRAALGLGVQARGVSTARLQGRPRR